MYEWKKKYRDIDEAIKKGKAPVDIEVENALLKRALGYDWIETVEEVYADGRKKIKRIKRHVPSDPASMFFWLKNRKPKQWRERPEVKEDSDSLKAARALLEGVDSVID